MFREATALAFYCATVAKIYTQYAEDQERRLPTGLLRLLHSVVIPRNAQAEKEEIVQASSD
jgi:hypothetical protein